jgi:hypothetical protein
MGALLRAAVGVLVVLGLVGCGAQPATDSASQSATSEGTFEGPDGSIFTVKSGQDGPDVVAVFEISDGYVDPRQLRGALNAFGIRGDRASKETLNRWTNIIRDTGADVNPILLQAINIGPSMRQLGYGADQVVQMFAQMNEHGEPMQRLVWSFPTTVQRISDAVADLTPGFESTQKGFETIITTIKSLEDGGLM